MHWPNPDGHTRGRTMQTKMFRQRFFLSSSVIAMAVQVAAPSGWAAPPLGTNDLNTKTPIKHVIVIYGENRSFDHVFATYVPKKGEKVWNLLSEGIVNLKRITQFVRRPIALFFKKAAAIQDVDPSPHPASR